MNFEFSTAGRILFGSGKRHELFAAAAPFGSRALLVTGADGSRADWARQGLIARGISVQVFSIASEPTLEDVEQGRLLARAMESQFVIGVGGGSAIDGAKAIAALATNYAEIPHYLEVIGKARPLSEPPLPLLAVPTTAGTGAEVTRNAVLLSREHQAKVSLRNTKMLPAFAIIDPELTHRLPPKLTATTGMDALTQLIEPFVCARANPLADALCREAIPRVSRALPIAVQKGDDSNARAEMALGSLFGGFALANSGLGAVHGFAAAIGGMFDAPHGAVCAALLPIVLETNLRALRSRAPASPILFRFEELGRLLTGKANATAHDAIEHLVALSSQLPIFSLDEYGVCDKHVDLLCSRAAQASSMKANPITLDHDELTEILTRAI